MKKSPFQSKEVVWFVLTTACLLFIFLFILIGIPSTTILAGGVLSLFVCFFSFKQLSNSARLSFETRFKDYEKLALIEYVHDGVVIYDTKFTVLTFNKASEEIFGISREIIIGKTIEPGLAQNPTFRLITHTLFPSLAPAAEQKSEPGVWPQITNISLENPKLEIQTVLNQITSESGEVLGFLKIIKDLTREKSVLEAKTDFINVAAHQLRTPITALHWALENIVTFSKGNETIYPIAQEALSVAVRAAKITNDLLDISKIEEGRFGYIFKDTDLVPFFQKIVSDIKPLADSYGISVSFASSLPSVFGYIDENRLSAVFLNLLDNAIRYNTKNGKVLIHIDSVVGKPFLKISVSDTGVGIPSDDLTKLFQKLHRGSNVVQKEPNGSGLGLYIAKNIVEQHGGNIEVFSEVNRGTTFNVYIPLDKSFVKEREIKKTAF